MNTELVATIIFAVTIVLFVVNKISPALVSLMAAVAFAAFGVLDFSQAFGGFASNTVMVIAGMMIVGMALVENGFADIIAKPIFEKFSTKPMALLVAVLVSSAILSSFIQNMVMLVIYYAIIDAYVVKSNGLLKRKTLYMIATLGTLVGGTSTLAGSAPPGIASSILEELGDGALGFFEPAIVGIPTIIVLTICYALFIHNLSEKQFYPHGATDDIPALASSQPNESTGKTVITWKTTLSVIVTILTIMSFIVFPDVKSGVIALISACVLMCSGCISSKQVIKKLDWSILILIAGTTGLANGFVAAGLDVKIITLLTNALGSASVNAAIWVIVFTVVTGIFTNGMSNSSTCAIFATLAISVASALGCSPRPLVMACLWGSCSGILLPTSCATVSMSLAGGLKVKDYLTIGTLYSVIIWMVTSASIIVWYGLY